MHSSFQYMLLLKLLLLVPPLSSLSQTALHTGAVNCLVGGGDGSVSFVNPALNKVRDQSAQLMGGCTSLALCPDGKGFFAGTELSNR
jgi:hypothetical protein